MNEQRFGDKQTRLDNLALLKEEFGSLAEIARRCSVSESNLSQIQSGVLLPSGKKRGIGDVLATRLEKGCKKRKGWMDEHHDDIPPPDAEFVETVKLEIIDREVPDHVRKTILTLLGSSPKK